MSFIFCQSCGTKIEYTLKKPNFCYSCGDALGSVSSASASSVSKPDQRQNAEPLESAESCPKLTGIEVEIIKGNNQEITLGNTVGMGKSTSPLARAPYQAKADSVVKDSINFCKPSKTKDIDQSG